MVTVRESSLIVMVQYRKSSRAPHPAMNSVAAATTPRAPEAIHTAMVPIGVVLDGIWFRKNRDATQVSAPISKTRKMLAVAVAFEGRRYTTAPCGPGTSRTRGREKKGCELPTNKVYPGRFSILYSLFS